MYRTTLVAIAAAAWFSPALAAERPSFGPPAAWVAVGRMELAAGRLTSAQRESIALAVGQANACQYCLSAHTLLGKGAGLSPSDIELARTGRGATRLDAALAALARQLTEERGLLALSDLETYRQAGVDEGLMLEVVAAVALNTLTNYTNHIAGTEVDFPVVTV